MFRESPSTFPIWSEQKCYDEAVKRVAFYMRMYYNVSLDDLEIAKTPGYWRTKKPVTQRGRFGEMESYHPTYEYREPEWTYRDTLGRFLPHHQTWRIIKEKENAGN